MKTFNRKKFLDGLTGYINRTLPVSETMPDSVCDRLNAFLRSSDPVNGAGILDDMYIEYCPEYEQGQSLWDLSRYGDDCSDDDRIVLRETAVAFGRYFKDGEDVARNNGEALRGIFLHRHQSEAVEAYRRGENILVCTGTGSGKTECFLIPIIDKLLRERKRQSIADYSDIERRHVHAMIMYPMNALVNDQVKRLRQIISYIDFTGDLAGKPITFGLYTSDLKRQDAVEDETTEAINACVALPRPNQEIVQDNGYIQNRGGVDVSHPIPSEYVTRDQWISEGPADILVTNNSMMEQMLIRPNRARIFKGGNWDFLVLDEAHSYTGSTGTEIAWQMRRLERRLRSYVAENDYRLPQCIATSATLVNGDAQAQEAAATEFMRGLFPIGNRAVFVGVDHLSMSPLPVNGLIDGVQLTEAVERLVEDSAELEDRLTDNDRLIKFERYLESIRNNDGKVSVSDALWLSSNPILGNVKINCEEGGWVDYFVKLVTRYSQMAYGDQKAEWNSWRYTLHDYESKEFSPDGKFLGNKLGYLANWRTRVEENDHSQIPGEEFSYLMLAVQVVQESIRQAGQNLGDVNFSRIRVGVQFEYNIADEGQQLQNQVQPIIVGWRNLLGIDIAENEFSVEGKFSYKDKVARYLLSRRDIGALLSCMSQRHVRKVCELIGMEHGPATEQELTRLLQLAGLARLAGHRKPLMDVKCHQAFRGISNVGVWFDDDGYHFTRSEEEYTAGDEQTRRKIFSLGICRECGQLYLLGYTDQQAINQSGDILWRKPVGNVRWLHAIAMPFGQDAELPYDNNKVVDTDDRDRPMCQLANHQGAQGRGPWAKWRERGVANIACHSIDLSKGLIVSRVIPTMQSVYWCLNAVLPNERNENNRTRPFDNGGEQAFIPRCPCCCTTQDRIGNAKYGVITPYEATSDQFVVASLESFAHSTVEDGNAPDAKVLAFSDSRQGASSLALNFEIASERAFAETAIRAAIGKYNDALEDANSELRKKVLVPRNAVRLNEAQNELLKSIGGNSPERTNELMAEIKGLQADTVAALLTVRNLVDWGLMETEETIPGVFDIDRLEANGRRRWMEPAEAQRFVVVSTLADPSSRSRTGVTFYSKTIAGMNLAYENYDGEKLKRCLQRIFRQLVKHCVIENSGNDYELRDGNKVFNGQGTPSDDYERKDKFTDGREYVKEAIAKFFGNLPENHRINLARYFWRILCDRGLLTSIGHGDCYKLDYEQLCSDIVLELDGLAVAPVTARYPFTIQEHTAQISGSCGAFYQRRFAEGKINILSCSTTFEMGIDVGGLNNVFLANLPHGTANYRQRAGRAGRRPGALAQVVTFVRDGNWGEDVLAKMLDGEVSPPRIYLESPVYKYRHLRAEALRFLLGHVEVQAPTRPAPGGKIVKLKWNHFGSFLIGFRYTWRKEGGHRVYVRDDQSRVEHSVVEQCVNSWLSAGADAPFGATKCDEYISDIIDVDAGEPEPDFTAKKNRLSLDLIFQLLGDNLISDFGDREHWTVDMLRDGEDYYIKRGGCYMPLPHDNGDEGGGCSFRWPGKDDIMRLPLRDRKLLMLRRMAEINDVDDGNWLSESIDSYMGHECLPMQRHLLNDDTISALSSCGVIPKYGFPIDVIELLTDGRRAKDVDLKRDMAIGLYEYAPGQVVIANKHEFDVYPDRRGVLFNDVSFTQLHHGAEGNGIVAWFCPNCKSIHDTQIVSCPDCLSTNIMRVAVVRPDAFKAEDKGRRHGFVRKTAKGQRIVRLASSARGDAFRVGNTALDVMFDANRTIAYYNANQGSGFNLSRNNHADGNDILARAFLSHDIHTDVVIWKLDARLFEHDGLLKVLLPQSNRDLMGLAYARARFRNAMASALEAVRIAASRHLQIPDREIGAFVYPNGESFWWVIYDAAQGGGGNVLALSKKRENDQHADETITAILRGALNLVSGCACTRDDILQHGFDSDYVCRRIPIPMSEYKKLSDYLAAQPAPTPPGDVYRVAKSCSRCIAPRYSRKQNEVFDCIDAALVLNAILTPMEMPAGADANAFAVPEGFHERRANENVLVEKWYYVRGDNKPKYRESYDDGLDVETVIAIED